MNQLATAEHRVSGPGRPGGARPLHVLHVIPSIAACHGGPSIVIRALARGLAEHGLQVEVATTDDNGRGRLSGIPAASVEAGVTYRFFPRQLHFYTFSWPLTRWLARHVTDYDLIHIHALFSFPSIAAAYWARRRGVPYILRPLGTLNQWGMQNRRPWLKKLSLRMIEGGLLRGAAAIHFTSEQERLEAHEFGAGGQAVIIPNPMDVRGSGVPVVKGKFRAGYPQLAGHTWFLFLSRFDAIKGLDLLLPAFAQVRAKFPGVVLCLAGDGDPAAVERLRQQAVQLGIASAVVWAGFLKGADKQAALADADVFVQPSYSESFGLAVVEAMQAGLPVIVSDRVGIHREIAQAQAGLVVPCQTGELAQAMLQLLADPGLRSSLGKNGQALAQHGFSPEAVTEQLVQMYRHTQPS